MRIINRLKNLWEISEKVNRVSSSSYETTPLSLKPEGVLSPEGNYNINSIFDENYQPPNPAIVTKYNNENIFPDEKDEKQEEKEENKDDTTSK